MKTAATKKARKHRHNWVPMRGASRIERPRVYNVEAKAWTFGRGPNRSPRSPRVKGPITGRRCRTCKQHEGTR